MLQPVVVSAGMNPTLRVCSSQIFRLLAQGPIVSILRYAGIMGSSIDRNPTGPTEPERENTRDTDSN
jgi:hypothetical protein